MTNAAEITNRVLSEYNFLQELIAKGVRGSLDNLFTSLSEAQELALTVRDGLAQLFTNPFTIKMANFIANFMYGHTIGFNGTPASMWGEIADLISPC